LTTRNANILRGVRNFSPLLQAFEAGYSADEIKQAVLDALRPEFEHPERLNTYGIDLLAVEYVNVQRVRSRGWSAQIYDTCLQIRRHCFSAKEAECGRVCGEWLGSISNGLALYWSAVRLERVKSDLPLEDFAYEIFRNTGALIEGTLQTYLKEMLHITRTLNGDEGSFDEINQLNLGAVVQQLDATQAFRALLVIPKWPVSLNQWRNIAQHFSLRADGALVRCTYGARNQYVIELSREELLKVARSLFLLYSAFRTAQTIFFLDNAESLSVYCKPSTRGESDRLFQFNVGAASQGFEVVALEVCGGRAFARLVDVSDVEELQRALHATQFTFQLWVATRAIEIEIEYNSKSGRQKLKSTVKGEDCKKVFNGLEDLSYLARVSVFMQFP
jgi:hypothetical protein